MDVPGNNSQDARAVEEFRTRLLAWYDTHARDLPWRQRPGTGKTPDPYRVWVSEIMLQQTRVAAVIAHYREFLRRFPTVEKLAAAPESSVLAAWSGLGYYRRARMLHRAAKVIVRERGGDFSVTANQWRELPGIGRYTAAAIASIAFGEPVAVVDGNVERVLQRSTGKQLASAQLWCAAEQLLDRSRPGDFNQAMMELGATVCTPRSPTCLTCPMVDLCSTRGELQQASRRFRQHTREIRYALCRRDGAVFLVQRQKNASLMPGMWELPELESVPLQQKEKLPPLRSASERNGAAGKPARQFLFKLRHSITLTDYTVGVWLAASPNQVEGRWIPLPRLQKLAITGLARKILRNAELLK